MTDEPETIDCGLCPWEWPNDGTGERRLTVHRQTRHGEQPLEGVTQLSSVNWRDRAIDAIRILAARDDDFAMYEIHNFGVGEPPTNHQTAWGQLAKDVHRLGIAHPVDFALSQRPGTRQSSVRKWSSDASRCQSCATKTNGASA